MSERGTSRLRVLVVYGTRPEAIKMAPVVHALQARPERFETVVCATAQHRDMLDQVQTLFGLVPDHDLDLMRPDQRLNEFAARALVALDSLVARVAPDWLLVQGDTTTAMIAALAGFHLRVRVGHVEAGLRTGDLAAPFPEEANRAIVDVFADALFAPTARAAAKLHELGVPAERVYLVGNTVVDALREIEALRPAPPPADMVLVTVHRRESFGAPLAEVFAALGELAARFPAVRWRYPVHPNPNVSGPAREALGALPNVELTPPVSYDELLQLLRQSRLVLTDSGGIQEEAPAFGKPTLVLRDKTERPEGVEAGVARLVGTSRARIVTEAARLLEDPQAYARMATAVNPYGDGRAAGRIAAILAGEPWQAFGLTASAGATTL